MIYSDTDVATEIITQGFSTAQNSGPSLDPAYYYSKATVMLAIGLAETDGVLDTNKQGDIAIEDATWGPSVGVFQIRTLKHPKNTPMEQARNIQTLQTLIGQTQSAAMISTGTSTGQGTPGTTFQPWTTFKTGKYRMYLPRADAAINAAKTSGAVDMTNADKGQAIPEGYTDTLKGVVQDAVSGITSPLQALSDFLKLLTSASFWKRAVEIIAGLVLIILGLVILNRQTIESAGVAAAALA